MIKAGSGQTEERVMLEKWSFCAVTIKGSTTKWKRSTNLGINANLSGRITVVTEAIYSEEKHLCWKMVRNGDGNTGGKEQHIF